MPWPRTLRLPFPALEACECKLRCRTGVTNADIIDHLKRLLPRKMRPKEHKAFFKRAQVQARMRQLRVEESAIETRLDMVRLIDGSFGCSW